MIIIYLFLFFVFSTVFNPSTVFAQTTPCCPSTGYIPQMSTNGVWECKSIQQNVSINARLCTSTQKCNSQGNCVDLTGIEGVFGKVQPPNSLLSLTVSGGAAGISLFLSNIVQLIFIVAGIIFLFMVIIGAVQWILSGGDKEAVGNARKRITHAIIGIVLLSLVFVIVKLVGQITGFTFF